MNLTHQQIQVADLHSWPGNARRGNVRMIADSLRQHGQYRPIVVQLSSMRVLAGNHTLEAARSLGWVELACTLVDCDDDQAARIVLVDNRANDMAGYDDTALLALLQDLPDLAGTGYTDTDLALLLDAVGAEPEGKTDPDHIPAVHKGPAISQPGDIWHLGPHRLMCGDSTDHASIDQLLAGETITMIHADPPYGMGKEADGVLNDNLYGVKLDAFQMAWWTAWKRALDDTGSAYIWGNAPELWRLWWVGGLGSDPDLMLRNELVWDKGSGFGMGGAGGHSYVPATERCLFIMRGQQFLGNQNKDDYWPGYEPLRVWLNAEVTQAGWTKRDVNRICGKQMAGHWLSQSQFMPIPEPDYETLAQAAEGRAFTKPYGQLFDEMFPDARGGGNAHRRELAAQLREQRTFFDNAHEPMTDVWQFGRVIGEDRHGHATPKPVAMVERAMKSSTRKDDLIGVPFGGSGPEFIAAHRLGRRVVGMELSPAYCDVIARRYEAHTGIIPVRDGQPVTFTAEEVAA